MPLWCFIIGLSLLKLALVIDVYSLVFFGGLDFVVNYGLAAINNELEIKRIDIQICGFG